ncbi:MAG: anthranilate synthase component I family protein, partial [Thermodesulfovibrionia bacterium]|nr:anthranilate synthase component I family protein [Thermodesulfovibrionia bacterium]
QIIDPDIPPFQGGAAGLLTYDFLHCLERVPTTTTDDLKIPDIHMFLFDRLISFDHKEHRAWAVVCPGARDKGIDKKTAYSDALEMLQSISARAKTGSIASEKPASAQTTIDHDVSKEQYEQMVARAKQYISAGDIFQANLSLRVSADIGERSPWDLYLALRNINPSPFAGYLDFGDYVIAGSSPERLVMVRDGKAELRPIAGTRPRGKDRLEDEQMRSELLLNPKERAEHIMLIDLERNDIGRVCDYGSVEVDELMVTEDYSHVIHIVSNVQGRLAPGRDPIDAIKATFPGGTITGVPKVRCMEIIDELEPVARGPYTGSIGYISFTGAMDLNIIIRTFVIKDSFAYVQAGAGIVADSDPEREYHETLKKAEALIKTLEVL